MPDINRKSANQKNKLCPNIQLLTCLWEPIVHFFHSTFPPWLSSFTILRSFSKSLKSFSVFHKLLIIASVKLMNLQGEEDRSNYFNIEIKASFKNYNFVIVKMNIPFCFFSLLDIATLQCWGTQNQHHDDATVHWSMDWNRRPRSIFKKTQNYR